MFNLPSRVNLHGYNVKHCRSGHPFSRLWWKSWSVYLHAAASYAWIVSSDRKHVDCFIQSRCFCRFRCYRFEYVRQIRISIPDCERLSLILNLNYISYIATALSGDKESFTAQIVEKELRLITTDVFDCVIVFVPSKQLFESEVDFDVMTGLICWFAKMHAE